MTARKRTVTLHRYLAFVSLVTAPGRTLLHAQVCAAAGPDVRVDARVVGSDTLVIDFAIHNRTSDTLGWLNIGMADGRYTVAVPAQSPDVVAAPAGWRGVVVYPEETANVHLWWEPVETAARIAPKESVRGFVIRVASPHMVPQGQIGVDGAPVLPIDFAMLPFTIGGTAGRCWWGEVTRAPPRP